MLNFLLKTSEINYLRAYYLWQKRNVMKCQDSCSNIYSDVKNLFWTPVKIIQAQHGRPAKIDFKEIISKSGSCAFFITASQLVYVLLTAPPNPLIATVFFSSTFNLFAFVAIAKNTRDAFENLEKSNALEFLTCSNPSKKLACEVLKSHSSRAKLLELAKKYGSLQKKQIDPLIAIYADRFTIDTDHFVKLFKAAPWSKEDKFACLKTLMQGSHLPMISYAIDKGLFQAEDLSAAQKQELCQISSDAVISHAINKGWLQAEDLSAAPKQELLQKRADAMKPLLEKLGCSPETH